jgi:endonuclease G
MIKKIILLVFVFTAICTATFAQQEATTITGKKVLLWENGTWTYLDSIQSKNNKETKLFNLEIPKTNPKETIIKHTGFSLLYNETHEQATWVAYELTKEETNKTFDRTDKFIVDPKVKTGTANDKDYVGSGYDRGHLAPAADMGWSATAMAQSFYYSNMSPQSPSFNRGIWKKLEELVRYWAIENNSVYVVTGPVLTSNLKTIGPNNVSVPNYYYKVILDFNEPNIKGIGFIMPNTSLSGPLEKFAVTIDSVEKFTGLDFFPSLPNYQEEAIEKNICLGCWTWKITSTASEKNNVKNVNAEKCLGITKTGSSCNNKTSDESGYCYLHIAQSNNKTSIDAQPIKNELRTVSVQCSGITKAGNRCKRMTLNSNGRCYQH